MRILEHSFSEFLRHQLKMCYHIYYKVYRVFSDLRSILAPELRLSSHLRYLWTIVKLLVSH
jgi:hypothetical protein